MLQIFRLCIHLATCRFYILTVSTKIVGYIPWYEMYTPESAKFKFIDVALRRRILIPSNRVLLEKLTGSQLVKKFSVFYKTRRFITAVTNARHLSLSKCFLLINSFYLLEDFGIPIEILAQCNNFKSKYLNNPTCNITQ